MVSLRTVLTRNGIFRSRRATINVYSEALMGAGNAKTNPFAEISIPRPSTFFFGSLGSGAHHTW